MRVRYNVTFEFETLPPVTHKGTVAASSAETVVKRAFREALAAHPGLAWSSLVIVLLERLQSSPAASDRVAPILAESLAAARKA